MNFGSPILRQTLLCSGHFQSNGSRLCVAWPAIEANQHTGDSRFMMAPEPAQLLEVVRRHGSPICLSSTPVGFRSAKRTGKLKIFRLFPGNLRGSRPCVLCVRDAKLGPREGRLPPRARRSKGGHGAAEAEPHDQQDGRARRSGWPFDRAFSTKGSDLDLFCNFSTLEPTCCLFLFARTPF